MSILFFIVGTIMLVMAAQEYTFGFSNLQTTATTENPGASPLEKLLLGAILFIPGSYHTFIAIMAWLRREGYTYEDVSVFESDEFWDKE